MPAARRWSLAVAVVLGLTTAGAGPATHPSADELRGLVERLAAADPAERAAAQRRLAAVGSVAIPVLTDARDDPRPEVAARATWALRRVRLFALQVDPTLPTSRRQQEAGSLDTSLRLADDYLGQPSADGRTRLIADLGNVQPMSAVVLTRLIGLEPDPTLRQRLLATVGSRYRDAVAGLLADGDADGVAGLLELAATDLPYAGVPDQAVFDRLTGRADAAGARWRAELANGDPPHRAMAAGHLVAADRAAGRADDAAAVAKRTGDPRARLTAALDRADWPAVADAVNDAWPNGTGTSLPLRAAVARLCGREGDVSTAVANYATVGGGINGTGPSLAEVKLLLGDVDGGLALLARPPIEGGDPATAVRLLRVRGQYDAAVALADRFAHDLQVGPAVAKERDEVLVTLGDRAAPRTGAPADDTAADDPIAAVWDRAAADVAAGRFAAAADALAPIDADPDRIDCHYLRGFALDAAGDPDRGRAMMAAATLVPLGDTYRRTALARRLASVGTAGLDAAAAEQRRLAEASADPFVNPASLAELAQADLVAAVKGHDPAAALAADERVWLLSFWPGVLWRDAANYEQIPWRLHVARAQAARARGDWPAVRAEVAAAQAILPVSIEPAVRFVPALDAHGDHAAADAVFAAGYDPVEAASAAHPNSALLHNQAAWLAACCDRRLADAVAHARSAVRLTGGVDGGFLDTLAECQFRLGDRAAAVATERRAAAVPGDQDAAYFARQLDRFEHGPVPSTTRPADMPE